MRFKKQNGFALVTLIIAMVLMAALGAGIYTVTTSSTFSELLAGKDYNAYQLAKAGLRYAAFNSASSPEGLYCMSGSQCFEITSTPVSGGKQYKSVGKVNQGTFLAAFRQLANNFRIMPAWSGPPIPFDPNDWQINKVPDTVIVIDPGPDGDINTPDDNTVTVGAGTGGNLAPDSYGSLWYQGGNTNGNCVNGICDFGYGLNAFFEFTFLRADTSADSTDYADGFTFAVISAINNTKDRTGGKGGGDSEGELIGYSGPGNTTPSGTAAVKDGLGLKPPKIDLEFDTYPNQGLLPIGLCANEGNGNGSRCSFSGRRSVAYGATVNGIDYYNYMYDVDPWSDYIQCNNATFGDPIVGTVKACYLLPANICDANSRYDQSVHNHAAIMFWGSKSAAVTDKIGRDCTAGSPAAPVSSVSFDDNMHGAGGTGGDPQNSVTASTALGGSTGYYHHPSAVTWMEDGQKYSVRMEIVRTDTVGGGAYGIKAWVVLSSSLTGSTESRFQDVTLPFTDLNYGTSRNVNLLSQDHSDFSKILYGFTASSGLPRLGGQLLTLENLKIFFPQQEPTSPCTYSLSPVSAMYTAAGGSGSFTVGTSSTCYWEAALDATQYNWISFTGSGAVLRDDTWHAYGQGNGTVNYTVSENTSFSPRIGIITVAGQTFTVTQAGKTCSAGQFLAEYFNDTGGNHLSGTPVFMTCENAPINWNWGTSGPGNGIGNDNFSARWTGQFPFLDGTYTFIATADDGVRVYVDGIRIINGWVDQGPTEYRAAQTLTAGSHTVVMEYYEHGGGAVAQLNWQFCPAISIDTASPLPDGTKGLAYSQQLAASVSNGAPTTYTWALDSGTLPAGLTLNTTTGLISGTPTSTGTSTFTVRVTGNCSADQTITKVFTVTIGCPAISITTASLPNGTGGVAYPTTTLTASAANGVPTTYTWAIDSGALPTGLSLNANTGVISGTPTGLGGDFTITVKATGNCSAQQTATKTFTFSIGCPNISITTGSLPNGTVGTAYPTTTLTASGATTYTWAIDSGALPTGLTLSSAGVISGTPTGLGGTFTVTVKATGSCSAGQIATKAFTLIIGCPPISISTGSPLPAGTVGMAYSQTLAAAPLSAAPFTWSVVSGSLPAGLTLSSAGAISGTPTAAGTASFTAQAMGSCSAGQIATKAFTLTIGKGTATVTLSNLTQTYTGSALTPTATTTPAGLGITWTGAPQTNAGTYQVTATVNNANYQGSATGSFVISKGTATVTLGNLNQTYTGNSLTPTATTTPAGLGITWTGAPQTNAGTYQVTATINNANYQGSASGSFVISKAAATVALSNMTQTYTGSALTPTATTTPAGLGITWTGVPQTNAGTYPVTATVSNANYQGSGSGSFVINKASQSIAALSFNPATLVVGGTTTVSPATATPSGLAVAFTSNTPSVCTVSGTTVTGVAAGACTIAGNQAGNANYTPATEVTQNIQSVGCPGQFTAQYFANMGLTGSPSLVRCDPAPLNFDWGTGSPGSGIPADQFSARWTGQFTFPTGVYTFIATADDGVRVWVDGELIINAWVDQAPTEYRANKALTAGSHSVVMEYYENSVGAVAKLRWVLLPLFCTTGGTITTSGGRRIHTFDTAGTFSLSGCTGSGSVTVQAIGGGGRGADMNATGTHGTGGGGGGAYAESTFALDLGASPVSFPVVVGAGSTTTAAGGDSSANTSSVVAKGGNSVATNDRTGAAGGQASGSIGAIRYNGGTGGTGTISPNVSGGGGGGAGTTGAGGNGGAPAAGAGTSLYGGNGGAGRTNNGDGNPGENYGGGGSGGRKGTGNATRLGGPGANGIVIISYPQ